ncbi:MAG: hypothetical protein OXG46_07370 [Chloroflexi bacterium]|nr:hypothetical protein [Chloroflexota bacterium]MCY3936748.1 hypothetical protein [Chloroflexota bacterium]
MFSWAFGPGEAVLLVVLYWASLALLVGWVAAEKGRPYFRWLVLGLVFGVFALIALAAVPSRTDDE